MDPFSIFVIVALIGYSIFQETPEQKAQREREEAARENRRLEEERRLNKLQAEIKERERPFSSAKECFQKQYVSYSRLSTYCTCPYRFKLIYLDKNPVCRSSNYTGKGSVFHSVIEKHLLKYKNRVLHELKFKNVYSDVSKLAHELGYLERNRSHWSEKQIEYMKSRRKVFRDNIEFLCDTFPNDVEVIAVEHKLKFTVNNINFYGIVDLVIKYPDGHLEIIDYKTGNILPIKEQLEIYSIPFSQDNIISSINFRVICVDRKSHYLWSLNSSDILSSTNNIMNIVQVIMNDHSFSPVINSHCNNCSVQYACKYTDSNKNYEKSYGRNQYLTKLNKSYEWKPGGKLPKSINPESSDDIKYRKVKKRSFGAYRLVRAKDIYECFMTKKLIQNGEYHFADHKGKRYCIEAFKELCPEKFNELIRNKQVKLNVFSEYIQPIFELVKSVYTHECLKTRKNIEVGEYHFTNQKGERYCIDAFIELYPKKAYELLKHKNEQNGIS